MTPTQTQAALLSDAEIAQCINQSRTNLFDRAGTTSFRIARAIEQAVLAKLQPAQEPARKPLAGLTREQMEAGRHQVFSTNNPFCPCDSKTFRKVSEWTEREFCRVNGLEVKT